MPQHKQGCSSFPNTLTDRDGVCGEGRPNNHILAIPKSTLGVGLQQYKFPDSLSV